MLPDNMLQLMMDRLVADGAAIRDGDSYKIAPITIDNIGQLVNDHQYKIERASMEIQSVIRDMMSIINSEADEDEKEAALTTLIEAIYGLY